MKKNVLILILMIFSFGNAFSQLIPNANFERWDTFPAPPQTPVYEEPENWTSYNSQYYLGYPIVVYQSATPCDSTYAIEIRNMQYINQISGLPDTLQGEAISGSNLITGAVGFPYTQRAISLEVCMKYTKAGADSAELSVKLTKYNSTSGQTQIISCLGSPCKKRIGVSSGSYYQETVPISFISAGVYPDTAIISFSPSSSNSQASVTPGSILWVDKVVLNTSVGINDNVTNNDITINVYPNPAKDEIYFSALPLDARMVRLIDITGKEVGRYSVTSAELTFNVRDIAKGIYIYEVSGHANRTLAAGKISVVE